MSFVWLFLLMTPAVFIDVTGQPIQSMYLQGMHLSLAGSGAVCAVWYIPASLRVGNFDPTCSFGPSQNTSDRRTSGGHAYTYTAGEFVGTLNMVVMNVTEAFGMSHSRYSYRCGDPNYGFDNESRAFDLQPDGIVDPVSTSTGTAKMIALVADVMHIRGRPTIDSIANMVQRGDVELIVHAGDIGYQELLGGKASVWTGYMDSFKGGIDEAMYMTVPGNHETQYNFASYLNWMKMPYAESGSTSPFWYSFNYLGVHFSMISTEHPLHPGSVQHNWLIQDLTTANQNRANVPWIIVVGHTQLYCSSMFYYSRCYTDGPQFRAKIELLLKEQRVDVYLNGHVHLYERTWPVYQGQRTQSDYIDPRAPVYINNGGGGALINAPLFIPFTSWSAYRHVSLNDGYLLMEPLADELRFQYIESRAGRVADRFTIMKGQEIVDIA